MKEELKLAYSDMFQMGRRFRIKTNFLGLSTGKEVDMFQTVLSQLS